MQKFLVYLPGDSELYGIKPHIARFPNYKGPMLAPWTLLSGYPSDNKGTLGDRGKFNRSPLIFFSFCRVNGKALQMHPTGVLCKINETIKNERKIRYW